MHLLARPGTFLFLLALGPLLKQPVVTVLKPPYPREGISDLLERGSILLVLTRVELFLPLQLSACLVGQGELLSSG